MIQRPVSFTVAYSGMSRILMSDAYVGQLYDPANPPDPLNHESCAAIKFRAIWDTGATNSAITQQAIDSCGLKQIGVVTVNTPNGPRSTQSYMASIFLPNEVAFGSIIFTEGTITGADILIGMDIICTGDFAVTTFGGKTTFTFRYPSCDCIDFVKQPPPGQTTQPVGAGHHIGRNDPCPCGSGKKYKRCHGANTNS